MHKTVAMANKRPHKVWLHPIVALCRDVSSLRQRHTLVEIDSLLCTSFASIYVDTHRVYTLSGQKNLATSAFIPSGTVSTPVAHAFVQISFFNGSVYECNVAFIPLIRLNEMWMM